MKRNKFKDYSDRELVLNYQSSSDNACLEELYRRYHQKVYQYCFTITKNKEHASDLSQDTFERVVGNLSRLKNSDTFISWLFHIARNLCLDHLKKQSKQKAEKLEEVFELADEIIDMEEVEAREHQLALMEILINELNQEDRAMLQLKYVDRVKIKDIQQQFALSESAIKMRLARARKKVLHLYQKRTSPAESTKVRK